MAKTMKLNANALMEIKNCRRIGAIEGATLALTLFLAALSGTGGAQTVIDDPDWRYSLERPADGWQSLGYNDSGWSIGPGGFGNPTTPGSRVGTDWNTKDIWLRRMVKLESVPPNPALYVHHDEDVEVFINGKLVLKKGGFVSNYQVIPIDAENREAIRPGENLIAVYCHQTGGGQFIDVHLVDAEQVPKLPKPKLSTTPFRSELITRWGKDVTSENVWQEYPRPQMRRDRWTNLNGKWDYTITPRAQTAIPSGPTDWMDKVLVPFAIESKLSGAMRKLLPDESLWYRRELAIPPSKEEERTLLHFEAVDYRAEVFLNGKRVGGHTGGNTAFQVDVTDAISSAAPNELVVRVDDDTEESQLRGKQVLFPGGIWYTQVSGIWQTVWLERVPRTSLGDLKISTDATAGEIRVRAATYPAVPKLPKGLRVRVDVLLRNAKVATATGEASSEVVLKIDKPELWSPKSPTLYELDVALLDENSRVLDKVRSYAGIRTVGKKKDSEGRWRFSLNDEILFHFGPLDQGWWPDGLLTPPSDAAMKSDIEFLKSAGFNMIRKHIKVEPRRYYYHCDQLGMLVWQDQVSGGAFANWTRLAPNPKDATWNDRDHEQYMVEFHEMVDQLENAPSIVAWTPFNEAWGQHRTLEVGNWIAKRDPTRSINIASGGNFWPVGDVADEHNYPHPTFPLGDSRFDGFVKVVGEFGGHGWVVPGHIWDKNKENWGYGGLPKTEQELFDRYRESIRILVELKKQGIAAGVYTQTTDVEGEVNGLMTYDREVIKIPAEELRKIHQPLWETNP